MDVGVAGTAFGVVFFVSYALVAYTTHANRSKEWDANEHSGEVEPAHLHWALIHIRDDIGPIVVLLCPTTERIRELEAQVAEFEAWSTEKKRYQLIDFGGGTYAYLLKQEAARGEPIHRICPACFEKRQKSILQGHGKNAFQQDMYECLGCGAKFAFGQPQEPRRMSAHPQRWSP